MKRVLTLLDSTMINVGTIIGSGIFLVPTTIALYLHSSILTLAVWLVAGVVTLFGALSMAELGAAMPRAGGQFVYLREAYGTIWGFLYGWASFAVINSAAIAALAVAFATYLGFFNPLTPLQIKLIAILSIVVFTLLNAYGVKTGVWAQNLLTFLKIGALLAIVVLGLCLEGGDSAHFQPFLPTRSVTSLIGPFGLALVAVLWSYDGWIEITYIGGEVRNPGRNIPLSLLYSVTLLIALYIVVNLVFMYLLSIAGIASSDLVASDAVAVVLGTVGTTLVILAILISTLGGVHVNVLACPRIYYAMAEEGLFFQALSRIHPKYGTPAIALLVQGIWSSLLVFTGTFEQLITYVVFASWIFYAMSCAGVMILRRKQPELDRPYKTWGYPWVPVAFIIFAALLVLNTIINDPRNALIGLGLILTGLPAYFYWKGKTVRQQ
ncbi:MAG: amino acid permease [Fidelibacterota bacterium]|nr:MAG: amino acid permease [Candidatus Neomarinimicrobiota bacterium]